MPPFIEDDCSDDSSENNMLALPPDVLVTLQYSKGFLSGFLLPLRHNCYDIDTFPDSHIYHVNQSRSI